MKNANVEPWKDYPDVNEVAELYNHGKLMLIYIINSPACCIRKYKDDNGSHVVVDKTDFLAETDNPVFYSKTVIAFDQLINKKYIYLTNKRLGIYKLTAKGNIAAKILTEINNVDFDLKPSQNIDYLMQ